MPNHVFTTMSVTAKTPEELASFIELARKPYQVWVQSWNRTEKPYTDLGYSWDTRESAISFNNFIPIPTEDYWDYKDEEGKLHQNWYGWNIENWDTKWDAYDVDFEQDASGLTATYRFTTAWSPPMKVYEAIAHQFPNLKIWLDYEEEQGWGGEMSSDFGSKFITHDKEWDIPESHADFVARDNEDGCVCSYDNDRSCWYEDCPRDEDGD